MTAPYVPQTWINGAPGGTPLSASRLNYMEAGIAGASSGAASALGIVNCSQMTTAAQINAASAAAPQGWMIWLGPRPPSAPLVAEEPIVRRPRRPIVGLGGRSQGTVVQAAAGFPTGRAVFEAEGWALGRAFADNASDISGIHVDCNSVAGVHGVLTWNFWCNHHDIQVANCSGWPFWAADITLDGTPTTNSHSENTWSLCRVMNQLDPARGGFYAQNAANAINGTSANQDGHLDTCFFAGVAGHGVLIDRVAGWTVSKNHLYGIGRDALRLHRAYQSEVLNNIVEDFGGENSGFYSGIVMTDILDGRASVLQGNTVSTEQPDSPAAQRYACYNLRAGDLQMKAKITVDGNSAVFASNDYPGGAAGPAVRRSVAYWLGENSDAAAGTRLLEVDWGTNQIEQTPWWSQTRVINARVNLKEVGRPGVFDLTDAATVTIDAARAKVHRLVALGNRTLAAPLNPVDGQSLVIKFTASGGARTLTLTTGTAGSFRFGDDVTALTATASGDTDVIGCVYDATAQRWDVVAYSKGYG